MSTGFIQRDEGGNPLRCVCLTLFVPTGRGDPTRHVCLMRQGTEHQEYAHLGILLVHLGILLVFVPSPSIQTCKTCPDGHILHVWCCLQHRTPETHLFGCFLVLGFFPVRGMVATHHHHPLPQSTHHPSLTQHARRRGPF